MSGTASVPTTFANAVTATGAQLDANYTTIVAYVNDPTNRNNFAADGAATNTVNVTFAPPVVGGYTTGLELTWKWGQTPTGGVVLNANGLGNISVVNPDGSALQGGQGTQGSIGKAVYDGTRAIYLAPPSPASQAQMATATASASFVAPSMVKFNPFVPKAWCVFDGTATGTTSVSVGVGVASVVRAGTGSYSINFSAPYASANYAAFAIPGSPPAVGACIIGARTTAAVTVFSFASTTGVVQDSTQVHFISFGVLP